MARKGSYSWWCTRDKKYYHSLGIMRHRQACSGKHIKDDHNQLGKVLDQVNEKLDSHKN